MARIREKVDGAKVEILSVDLSDFSSIRSAASEFEKRFGRLDVLVNNAGVWPKKRSLSRDGFEMTFAVNHLGTFLLTQALLPLLKKTTPSRVVTVSSALHRRGSMHWDDLQLKSHFSGTRAYAQSKLANILFTKALARRLKETGVIANCLHPGVVSTELGRDMPLAARLVIKFIFLTPQQGAATSVYLASAPEVAGINGEYFERKRPVLSSNASLNERDQERLWDLSSVLTGG